jgi:hypothetical protein
MPSFPDIKRVPQGIQKQKGKNQKKNQSRKKKAAREKMEKISAAT